jgi:periplasmic copper chaperone A
MPRMVGGNPRSRVLRGLARAALIALACALLLGGTSAYALFIVNQPWVKPGIRTTEAYMVLTSTEGATLVGVHSAVASGASLRGAGPKGGRAPRALPLPAGEPVPLRPGAQHIALTGLKRALKLGERVALTLTIATATGAREEIAVDAEVRNESPLAAERRAHPR